MTLPFSAYRAELDSAAYGQSFRQRETREKLLQDAAEQSVIETLMPVGEEYVANDVQLDCDGQQIIIITGPNMAGKSALLRQTALITLLGQMGSFVPADSARIGLVDKIFTRVGASDNISVGESTFMVEMSEAANIMNNQRRSRRAPIGVSVRSMTASSDWPPSFIGITSSRLRTVNLSNRT